MFLNTWFDIVINWGSWARRKRVVIAEYSSFRSAAAIWNPRTLRPQVKLLLGWSRSGCQRTACQGHACQCQPGPFQLGLPKSNLFMYEVRPSREPASSRRLWLQLESPPGACLIGHRWLTSDFSKNPLPSDKYIPITSNEEHARMASNASPPLSTYYSPYFVKSVTQVTPCRF